MKTTKTRSFVLLSLVVVLTLAMSCFFLTACDDEEGDVEKVAITWSIPDDVTVSMDGCAILPAEWVKGAEMSFAVTGPAGYTVTVKAGASNVANKNGAYTYKPSRDVTITVTAERTLTGITATTTANLEKQYYVDSAIAVEDITVTASYAVGDDTVVTSGFTVEHGKADAENVFTPGTDSSKFVAGDNAFRITYKNFVSQVFKLTLPVDNQFGFTSVDIELGEDGKPYYVVRGTYAADEVDDFEHVGFDFQEQGFYSEALGGSQLWAYVKYNTSVDPQDLVDGKFVIRVDMSGLADNLASSGLPSMLFNAHMGFNTPGDNSGNLNVDTENYEEGKSVTVGAIKYELHRAPDGAENAVTTWGMVGVIVTNTDFKDLSYVISGLELEVREDKVFLVYTGACTGYTQEDWEAAYFDYEGGGALTVNVDKLDAETGEFAISFDITAMPEGTNWLHHKNGTTNVAAGTINADKITVTNNGVTYTLTDEDQWNTGGRKVIVEGTPIDTPETPDAPEAE